MSGAMEFLTAEDIAPLADAQASLMPHRATLARVTSVRRPGGGLVDSLHVVRDNVPCRAVEASSHPRAGLARDQMTPPPGQWRVSFAAGTAMDDGYGRNIPRLVVTRVHSDRTEVLTLRVVQVERPVREAVRTVWCDEVAS